MNWQKTIQQTRGVKIIHKNDEKKTMSSNEVTFHPSFSKLTFEE